MIGEKVGCLALFLALITSSTYDKLIIGNIKIHGKCLNM